MRFGDLIIGALACVALAACERSKAERSPPKPPPAPLERANGEPLAPLSLLDQLSDCDVHHRGILIDLGGPAEEARRAYAVGPFDDVAVLERTGARFTVPRVKHLTYEWWLEQPRSEVHVSVRAMGGAARWMSVYIDDRRLGAVRLSPDEPRIHTLPPLKDVPEGRHSVAFRFNGRLESPDDGYAAIDWVRIGWDDESPESYPAPTTETAVADVVIDGHPRRAIVLRAPGKVRCALKPIPGSRLRLDLGYWGTGKGAADVRIVEDGEQPIVLAERRVSGGHGSTWTRLEVEIGSPPPRLLAVELRALETTGVGRIAFGEPEVVPPDGATPPQTPDATIAVVVVAAGLKRRHVPPWGDAGPVPSLATLSRDGVVFDGYRSPTTMAPSVMASLVTGLPPRAHGLEDPGARLPEAVRAISQIVKEASGRTAMFTGVPTTFAAFGFDRGWDRFETFSPVEDLPATQPYAAAVKWLKERLDGESGARHLLILHTRGAHPPWDLTKEEESRLPPEEYEGPIQPRRGAINIASVRTRRLRAHRRLDNKDWVRLQAIQEAALRKEAEGLGRLMETLEQRGMYDRALIVFMGDVSMADPPEVPFEPAGELGEARLTVPLLVKFPGGALASRRTSVPVTTVDVARTVLLSLGLKPPAKMEGMDLGSAAVGAVALDGRPLTATLGNGFVTKWGDWLLRGELRRTPSLCRIDVDPACAGNLLEESPIAATALWRRTFATEKSAREITRRREPATIDPETRAALKVFGY